MDIDAMTARFRRHAEGAIGDLERDGADATHIARVRSAYLRAERAFTAELSRPGAIESTMTFMRDLDSRE